jgi:pimeloyl-ACP methyl ester carboxylesterase
MRAVPDEKRPGGAVVLVHGLWMKGLELRWLGLRLAHCGFDPHYFHYLSLQQSPAEGASELAGFIRALGASRLHLVAHSLGGIVLLHLFERLAELPPGRVVLLGCPVLGSGVARVAADKPWLRPLLGRNLEQGLMGDAPRWNHARELGVIAGTRGVGLGRLVGGLRGRGDGTVSLCETRLPGAKDFCSLRVNHMGMVLSSLVARETCNFLHYGRFLKGQGPIR